MLTQKSNNNVINIYYINILAFWKLDRPVEPFFRLISNWHRDDDVFTSKLEKEYLNSTVIPTYIYSRSDGKLRRRRSKTVGAMAMQAGVGLSRIIILAGAGIFTRFSLFNVTFLATTKCVIRNNKAILVRSWWRTANYRIYWVNCRYSELISFYSPWKNLTYCCFDSLWWKVWRDPREIMMIPTP